MKVTQLSLFDDYNPIPSRAMLRDLKSPKIKKFKKHENQETKKKNH